MFERHIQDQQQNRKEDSRGCGHVFLCKNQQVPLRLSLVLKAKDFSDTGAHPFAWGSNGCCNWVLGMANGTALLSARP